MDAGDACQQCANVYSFEATGMDPSRRSLIRAGIALGAAPLYSAAARAADSSFDPWVEIHSGHLEHNVREISRRVTSRPIFAVIKNNGYGMGVSNAARLLEPSPAIAGLAVVKLHEAMTLREAGTRKPVLLMGPFDESNLEDAVGRGIMPMVYTPVGPWLDRIAGKRQKPVPVHVCVDTGIGRVGVPYREAAPLIRDLAHGSPCGSKAS
jgi:alanine racemase